MQIEFVDIRRMLGGAYLGTQALVEQFLVGASRLRRGSGFFARIGLVIGASRSSVASGQSALRLALVVTLALPVGIPGRRDQRIALLEVHQVAVEHELALAFQPAHVRLTAIQVNRIFLLRSGRHPAAPD